MSEQLTSEQRQAPLDSHQRDKMSHERYLRTGRSSRSRVKVMGLAVVLAVSLLILLVVSIYSAAKISSLGSEKMELEYKLSIAAEKLEILEPQLKQSRTELNDLVASRFPNLQPMVINNMLSINEGLIKQVVFTKIKQGDRQVYKYLVVVENNSIKKINPSFRVLLFDEFGVHVGNADVVDKRVLKVGESRDYTDEFDLFFESIPKHFYIEDLSAQYNTGSN